MEMRNKFSLPWRISINKDEDMPQTVDILDVNESSVFCGMYWDTKAKNELIVLFEFIIECVNKNGNR
jgi:hypothetical protein